MVSKYSEEIRKKVCLREINFRETGSEELILQGIQFYRCIIYPTGGKNSVYMKAECTNPENQPLWAEDLDLRRWLPRGNMGIRISNVPGTKILLRNSFMIFIAYNRTSSLPNASIAQRFNQGWKGNIIVVKLGCKDVLKLEKWLSDERAMVDFVVNQYVCRISLSIVILTNLHSHHFHPPY
jgi:hypothetical protein